MACNGSGIHGGNAPAPAPVGGGRRRQFHMVQDMRGVEPRQNAVIDSLETHTQRPSMAVGSGMGARDQSVRMAHRDRARMRSMEDPRYSLWRGNPTVNAEMARASEIQQNLRGSGFLSNLGIPILSDLAGAIGLGKGQRKASKMSKRQMAKRQFELLNTPKPEHLPEAEADNCAYHDKGCWHVSGTPITDEELEEHALSGGSFFGDLWNGVKSVGNFVKPFAEPIGNLVGTRFGVPNAGTIAKGALDMLGSGKHRGHEMEQHSLVSRIPRPVGRGAYGDSSSDSSSDSDKEGGYARTATQRHIGMGRRKASSGADGRAKRNAIVRKVMAEKGLKMIEASKYVKEHGLY